MGNVYSKITSEIEWVTPEKARHLRRTANFERQRNIKSKNVNRLCNEMIAGRFIPGTQVYLCELPNGELRIANGNHTLEAVALSGQPQCLTVTKHKVKNLVEVGDIYAVFDIHAIRTWNDSAKALGIDDQVPMLSKVMPAVKAIERGFTKLASSEDSRTDNLEAISAYAREAEIFSGLVRGCTSDSGKLLSRAGVLAIILETLKYQPSLGAEFWGDIVADDGLRTGMPEKALLNWLRNNKSAGGKVMVDNTMIASVAWNAKFEGEEIKRLKIEDTSTFHLLGTPHAKGFMPRYLIDDFESTDSAKPASAAIEDYKNFEIAPDTESSSKPKKSKIDDIVQLGSIVIYKNLHGGEQKIVQIAKSTADADPGNGVIPSSSPLAKSMLGKKSGDECSYSISTGIVENVIEEIDNL